MKIWKCTKTVIMDGSGLIAFTVGREYTQIGETDMVTFVDDQGHPHCVFGGEEDDTIFLHEHFVKVASEAEKEADREAERQELWQPGDEPYEPDYWGAHYE